MSFPWQAYPALQHFDSVSLRDLGRGPGTHPAFVPFTGRGRRHPGSQDGTHRRKSAASVADKRDWVLRFRSPAGRHRLPLSHRRTLEASTPITAAALAVVPGPPGLADPRRWPTDRQQTWREARRRSTSARRDRPVALCDKLTAARDFDQDLGARATTATRSWSTS